MGPGSYVTSTASYYNTPKRGVNKRFILFVVIGLVIIVVAVFSIVSLANRDNLGSQSQHLAARLNNLDTLTAAAAPKIGSGDLKKLNAETTIIVDGVQSKLSSTLPKKVDKSVTADESDASVNTRLTNAGLTGTYDSVYKATLREKLESVTALLSEMEGKTKSASLHAKLAKAYANLQALLNAADKLG